MNGTVEGNPGNMTSFRTEAQGLVNLLWSGGITEKTRIYLDNKSVVKKVNEEYPLNPMQSEWELLEPARRKIKQNKLQVYHVKGHQENKKKNLTWAERLNTEADKLAREAYTKPQTCGYLPTGYEILLYINGNRITTKISKEILRAATTPDLRDYYTKKYKWTDESLDQMDWNAQHEAILTFPGKTQRMLHKHMHGWLPTGKQMHRRHNIVNKCPYCQKPEDENHMINCTGQQHEKDIFKKYMTQRLKMMQTEDNLRKTIITYLFTRNGLITNEDPWIKKIITAQNKIGRYMMWRGFITQQWGDYMEHYYRKGAFEKQYSGTTWAKRLVTYIFTYDVEAWQRRNNKMHQDHKHENPHRDKLIQNIRDKYRRYEHKPEVLPCLYKHKLRTLLQKKTKYLLRWNDLINEMENIEAVKKKRRAGQDIRKYLSMMEKPPE